MITKSKRFAILARDEFRCQYCGATAASGAVLQLDHINPLSRGGNDSLENLVTACFDCNNGKRNRTIDEAIAEINCRLKARSALNGVIDAMQAYAAAVKLDMISILREHGVTDEEMGVR